MVAAATQRTTTFILESFLLDILQVDFLESGKVLFGWTWFFREVKGDGRLFDFYLQSFVKFQQDGISFYAVDFPMDASNGYHIISFFYFIDKLLGFLLFFLLWTDHEEVHDQDNRSK